MFSFLRVKIFFIGFFVLLISSFYYLFYTTKIYNLINKALFNLIQLIKVKRQKNITQNC